MIANMNVNTPVMNMNSMTMLNVNNILNQKDSRWLQLEVCREFQRNKCSRPDTECKFAHPLPNVEVQSGRVTACYDSIKGRCSRENPPCKYFHPPQHLKDQLLINGRNHLALKNALIQQIQGIMPPGSPALPAQMPTVVPGKVSYHQLALGQPFMVSNMATSNPYIFNQVAASNTISPYGLGVSHIVPQGVVPVDASGMTTVGVLPQTVVTTQKVPRTDRLEAFPGVVPYKRPAGDKSGMPVYQPSNAAATAAAYQQLVTLQQQFVPVSCEYTKAEISASSSVVITSSSSTATSDSNSCDGTGNDKGMSLSQIPASSSDNFSDVDSDTRVIDSELSSLRATSSIVRSSSPIASTLYQSPSIATYISSNPSTTKVTVPSSALYTGVALNKQAPMSASLVPFNFCPTLPGINPSLNHPLNPYLSSLALNASLNNPLNAHINSPVHGLLPISHFSSPVGQHYGYGAYNPFPRLNVAYRPTFQHLAVSPSLPLYRPGTDITQFQTNK